MATSRILSCLVIFAVITGLKAQEPLSVTDYGSLQISMVRHGEKYATNRDCYSYEVVSPLYHGMTHVRGPNDKNGKIPFKVSVPVIIYLAVDARYPYIHGDDYEATGDLVMLGGCRKRTKFPIYRSRRVHGPGLVTVDFTSSRMTGIFLRDNAYEVRPYAELKVTFPGTPREISMVRDGEKFSTNRACYTMVDIPPKYHGLTHLRGPNDETTITFYVNIPVMATGSIVIDLSKAFDSICHNLLLAKLSAYGVGDAATEFLHSYLSERKQIVKVNGIFSDWLPVYCGVPQSSLLGPLLFNIFINDLNFVVQVSSLRLYADDTTTYASDSNTTALELSLNQDLDKLSSWFSSNYLSINQSKTQAMILGNYSQEAVLHIGDSTIEITNSLKILGVQIDNKLSLRNTYQLF
ncbi:hypothetical protein ACROYT_G029256 [Oculina patagonica]